MQEGFDGVEQQLLAGGGLVVRGLLELLDKGEDAGDFVRGDNPIRCAVSGEVREDLQWVVGCGGGELLGHLGGSWGEKLGAKLVTKWSEER